MVALTKIQHFCMKVLRVTMSSVSVSLLPEWLGTSSQFNSLGIQTWRFTTELNTNFEVHGILHLPT
jgi:hypothetical protein